MNKVKPRHPRSLVTEPSAQGSKRKATEGEDAGLGHQTRAEVFSPMMRKKTRSSE